MLATVTITNYANIWYELSGVEAFIVLLVFLFNIPSHFFKSTGLDLYLYYTLLPKDPDIRIPPGHTCTDFILRSNSKTRIKS